MKLTVQQAEQELANQLFLRYGLVLIHDYVSDGEDRILIGLDFIRESSGSGYFRTYYNGKTQIRVGRFAKDRSVGFKEKKDGTHNYEKIADKLAYFFEQELARKRNEERKWLKYEANTNTVDRICEKLGVNRFASGLEVTSGTGMLKFTHNVTPEQAEKLLKFAIENNIIAKTQ